MFKEAHPEDLQDITDLEEYFEFISVDPEDIDISDLGNPFGLIKYLIV